MRQKHAKKCHRNSMQKLMSKSIVSELFCLILGCPWTSIWGPRGHPKNVIMSSVLWICVCTLLGVLGGTPKMQMRTFFFKNHVFCEGDFQNLAFRSRLKPKEPQKTPNGASKRHPKWHMSGSLWPHSRMQRLILEKKTIAISKTKPKTTWFFWSSRNACKGQKKKLPAMVTAPANATPCDSNLGSAAQAARPFNQGNLWI